MHIDPALIISGLLLAGFLCQWLAWRVNLPAILFLLVIGIAVGPGFGLMRPDDLLGELLFPVVSLGVAVILFEGSLTLNFREVRGVGSAILLLCSVGALITLAVLAWAAHALAGLSWELALLFGALTCVTGPTVIIPMLRSVRPNVRIGNVLRWEGIIIDPLGALFAVLIFEWITLSLKEGVSGIEAIIPFAKTVLVGVVVGYIAAQMLSYVLRKHLIPEYLQNYATLALVLLVFAGSNALAHESGLLTVTVMGMKLANDKRVHMEEILHFKEHLSTLLISMLFILLAARLDWPSPKLFWAGVGILVVAQFIARPLSVFFSTLGSSLTWRERGLLSWIAPRGIVAAAVSALFALKLDKLGMERADELVPLTFMLIIGTVVLQSATSSPMARLLKVAQPKANGVLVVGASLIARVLAKSLKDQKIPVMVADSEWQPIRAARMDDLPTFYGNPASEYADVHLDLTEMGQLVAMSDRREMNTLACVRYRPDFGKNSVYYLNNLAPDQTSSTKASASKEEYAQSLKAQTLFGNNIAFSTLNELLLSGWQAKTTRVSETFRWEDFVARFEKAPILLYAINEKGEVRFRTSDDDFTPKAGFVITALVDPKSLHEDDPGTQQLRAVTQEDEEPENDAQQDLFASSDEEESTADANKDDGKSDSNGSRLPG